MTKPALPATALRPATLAKTLVVPFVAMSRTELTVKSHANRSLVAVTQSPGTTAGKRQFHFRAVSYQNVRPHVNGKMYQCMQINFV